MKRLSVPVLLLVAACGGGGSSATLVPNFQLLDVNGASPSAGQNVSPRDYQGDVSAWYFGDALTAYAVDQFGLLDKMQDELFIEARTLGATNIQILGVNKVGSDAGAAAMIVGRDLPLVQDTAGDAVQASWAASDGDVVIVDKSNLPLGTYNLIANDLSDPANYEELKLLIRGGPAEPAPDFSVLDVNPNSPTTSQNVSPRDYIGSVSGYYFGAAT
ncbi:MAG TPA: hypothetical protein VFY93_01275 [Planctomycetota bacterium]|nr:hypothetical protein [Planctomycetota bacterium]